LRWRAQRYSALLAADYAEGYEALDRAFRSPDWQRVQRVATEVSPHFSENLSREFEAIAQRERRPIEWAVANAFVQDVVAMSRMQSPPPLMSTEVAMGYRILADVSKGTQSTPRTVTVTDARVRLPGMPSKLSPGDVQEISSFLMAKDSPTLRELLEFRRHYGAPFRAWIQEVRTVNTVPLPSLVAEYFDERDKSAERFVSAAAGASAAIAAGIWGSIFAAVPAAASATGLGIAFARRYRTRVGRWVARLLSPQSKGLFLLETPAWSLEPTIRRGGRTPK
jgi:hypothetical protein